MSARSPISSPDRESQVARSKLACHTCKIRKIKCDRELPSCSACMKWSKQCSYPLSQLKPGPKSGGAYSPAKRLRISEGPEGEPNNGPGSHHLTAPEYRNTTYSDTSPKSIAPYGIQQNTSLRQNVSPTGLLSPNTDTSPSTMDDPSFLKGRNMTQMMHPVDDMALHPQSKVRSAADMENRNVAWEEMITQVCITFGITQEIYHHMIDAYFESFMSFCIFHRPRFNEKLIEISSQVQLNALLASMFVFSSRFLKAEGQNQEVSSNIPSPEDFHNIALQLIDEALLECLELAPPICLLQASILASFEQLIHGVSGRAWRYLGQCVRMAYELQLHLIDSDKWDDGTSTPVDQAHIYLEEEKRRAWWAIWEMDSFASTIRRLPTAIDWTQIETELPMDDETWFRDESHPSCRLDIDPGVRWKLLEKSGSKGPKAWFIVAQSLMQDAQLLSNPRGLFGSTKSRSRDKIQSLRTTAVPKWTRWTSPTPEAIQINLAVIANSLCCFTMNLPAALVYEDERLYFRAGTTHEGKSSRQQDSNKHCIHLMIQLTRFMIHHYNIFCSPDSRDPQNPTPSSSKDSSSIMDHPDKPTSSSSLSNRKAWIHYLEAADNIVTCVRNSSATHVRYVNPFLASTVWLAAAAQAISLFYEPSPQLKRFTESKLDVLRSNFAQYRAFWDTPLLLQQKLDALEERLKARTTVAPGVGEGEWQDSGTLESRERGESHEDETGIDRAGAIMMPYNATPRFMDVGGPPMFDFISNDVYNPFNSFNLGLDDVLTYSFN